VFLGRLDGTFYALYSKEEPARTPAMIAADT
jgi:hypothetical protein